VVLANRSPEAIAAAAAADIHPPAYYLLLAGWGRLFGLSEVGARSLSALIGVALVGALYGLAASGRRPRLGLVAALLAAVNPFLVYYSQEARMYELVALLAVLTAWAVLLWSEGRDPRPAAALYGVGAVLGLYTHYAFPIHLLALNLVWLIRWWGTWPRGYGALVGWAALQLAVGLAFLPWLPVAVRQLSTWPAPTTTLTAGPALAETVRLFLCGPIPCPNLPGLLWPAAGLGLGLAGITLPAAMRDRCRQPLLVLAWAWLLAVPTVMVAFQLFSPVLFKFLLMAAPAYLLLTAMGLDILRAGLCRRWGRYPADRAAAMALGLLLLAAMPVLDRYYHDPTVARDDYRGIAAYLRSVAGPDDAVILTAPGQWDAFSRYDHGPAPVYPLPTTRPLDPDDTLARLEAILGAHRRIYAVYWAVEQADPAGLIETTLAARAFKAWDAWVGNLRFVAYAAGSPPPMTPLTPPVAFGDAIVLTALGRDTAALVPGDIARVSLEWQALRPPATAYKVTLQILDPADQVLAQVDAEPVGGTRPTTGWVAGEIVTDPYGLPIPLATPPGAYRLILALYDPLTGARLSVAGPAGVADHLELGAVTVVAPRTAPPAAVLPVRYRQEARRGPLTFIGHNRFKHGFGHAPDTPLQPGDRLHLTTFWRAETPPDGDYQVELRMDGRVLGRFSPAGVGFPTSRWPVGLPWRGEHTIVLPPEWATGRPHRLSLQLLAPDGRPVGRPIRLDPPLVY
ncbi:MAG: glycosyltransferase family 39 protein, partial [Anaerolineae bacterium]|nr:glycosyltransferase family 39 protein [Anaerolineae bacterium]